MKTSMTSLTAIFTASQVWRRALLPALAGALALVAPVSQADVKLVAVLGGTQRAEANVLRDIHRLPYETLQFFGLKDDMTVVESWAGGGWYTEILAPYLKDNGRLYAATYDRDPATQAEWQGRYNQVLDEKLAGDPDSYGKVKVVGLVDAGSKIARAGSVDMVLDFRNAHNWIRRDDPGAIPKAWHRALKPGGVVGIVDHRMDAWRPYNPRNGYVHERQVIEVMEANGFRFFARSDHLSNPRDAKDHEMGVWTLPPTLRKGEEDRNRYLAIGESDRMVLKFVKR